MSTHFVTVDRDTPMLLPPDLRAWVPGNPLVHFLIEAVEPLDRRCARVNERGSGRDPYPPAMMLGRLIYSYATEVFGRRRIEQSTYDSVAVRLLCGDTPPDHDILLASRMRFDAVIASCLPAVLRKGSNWPPVAGSSKSATSRWPSTARRCWPTPANTPP